MRNKYLYSVLPFLKKCKRETQQQFEDIFRQRPAWLMEFSGRGNGKRANICAGKHTD